MRHVRAEYRDGLLKPDRRLHLRAGERVRLIIIRESDRSRWDLKRLASHRGEDLALAEAGLSEWLDALAAEDNA